jgi:alpha-2-macroglobulin
MTLRRLLLKTPLVLLVLLALLSCHEPVNLPPVQGPPLAIPEGRSAASPPAAARGLEVIYVSPKGQLDSPHAQITISFSKPMVALERADKRAEQAPLSITPHVAGKQRWLGSRTLTFQPDRPLPGSTAFELRVPKGLRALDGSELEKEERWSFTTPLLQVSRITPSRGSRWEQPDAKIELFFNQPVAPKTLEQHAVLEVRKDGGSPMRVTVVAKRARDPQHLVLHPQNAFPLDAEVMLRLDRGLTGTEGPRPMGAPYSLNFRTYGPLRLVRLSCTSDCDPERSIELELTNPVARDEGRAAIHVNGAPLGKQGGNWASSQIYLDSRFKARTKYTVAVAPKLKDKFGQTLEGPRSLSFATGDLSPYVYLPIKSGVLEASAPRNLPIYFRNADSAQLYSKRLDPPEVIGLLGHSDYWDTSKVELGNWKGAQKQTLKVAARRNQRIAQRVDLSKLLGAKRGLLALELETSLRNPREHEPMHEVSRAVVRITDLAITAKYSPHTSLAWVTSLATGKPVPGCTVSIWRGTKTALWTGTTDAGGLAVGPGTIQMGEGDESHRFFFFAEKGGDQSFVESTTQAGIRAWDFGMEEAWDDDRGGTLSMIFTDRGIYRPGDTVHIKGVVRRNGPRGLETPRGQPVALTVNDARGEKLLTDKRELSDFGSFALDMVVPASAPLGSYSITGKLPGGSSVYGSFRVEEYRPADFSVSVQTERKEAVRGDSVGWNARGNYLFGSPMRGAELRWTLYREGASFVPPNHEGYVFSDEVYWWGDETSDRTSGLVAQGQGKLDDKGKTSGSVPLKPPKMTGPQTYELEVNVADLSRQTISSRTSVLLHPGEHYLGAKPKETFLKTGDKLKVEVVAVTPDGKRLSGVPVEGKLYRREWSSVRKEGMGGSHYFVTRPVETAAGACQVQSAATPKPCEIEIGKAGYYVMRFSGKDRRGNPLMTSFGVYVAGDDYVAWRRDNESRVELVTDRKSYKVGQVARILVKSPYSGAHGLFTVERNGIYTRRPIKLERTSAWLEVPITEDLVPTAYVSVVLVRGRVKATTPAKAPKGEPREGGVEEDPGQPSFKVGYAKLSTSQANRKLAVKVQPARGEYRPGQEVVVDLQVKSAVGKGVPAELTVFVADEGVLSLIGYRTPDPMSIFYAERGLSVRTADNRLLLISQKIFGEKGKNPGGGGAGEGAPGEGVRRTFVTTPYFNPAVLTDGSGKAQVRFKLPDNLTTFRVMAVAVSREAEFGSGQGKLLVNKPLLMLPALPRVVRVGDHFEAGVVLHNRGAGSGNVQVRASVRGVQLEGTAERSVTLAEGGSAEARFTFVALHPGEASFRFEASLAEQGDKLELKRPVKLPLVVEAVATFGSTEHAVAEGIAPASGVRPDFGGLELTLSSTAMVGLKPGMEYLLDYPYECLEQTTSRLVPLVLLRDLRQAFKLKTEGDPDTLIRKLIGKAEQMQRWDGGFSYWPSEYESYPWVSAYAAWGLHRAKQHGFRVSERVLQNARRYLTMQLNKRVPPQDEALYRNLNAFIVHVAAELGDKPAAAVNNLYEKRADLAVFAQAQLLDAMMLVGSDRGAVDKLKEELIRHIHQTAETARVEENLGDAYAPFFHSLDRSTAMAVEALLRVQPDHPLIEKMVRHLLKVRRDGHWRNTQETAYALMGLHSYFKVREREVPDFVAKIFMGEQRLLSREFRGRSMESFISEIPMATLVGAQSGEGRRGAPKEKQGAAGNRVLGFVKDGPGRLYYGARLRYARATLPKEPWDEGFYVTRTYERVNEDALRPVDPDAKLNPVERVRAGDLVRVTLQIVAPQHMHFVAVEDPLPSGLEAMNFKLQTASSALSRLGSFGLMRARYGRRSYGSPSYSPFGHQEVRDDRMQLFSNNLPPGLHRYSYLARATAIGKFVAPPTHAEEMYNPEVFGRSGATSFEVTEK